MKLKMTAEQLADMVGFGDLYRASAEQEKMGEEMAENIKRMMRRVDYEARKRLPDMYD